VRISWVDRLVSDSGGWLDGLVIRHDLDYGNDEAARSAGEVVPGVGIRFPGLRSAPPGAGRFGSFRSTRGHTRAQAGNIGREA
jgi:hypothetical protein